MARLPKLLAVLAVAGLFAAPALAEKMPLPADTPAAYKTECGSCHLAYPPALLRAADWQRTMAGLDKHFGADAGLDATASADIARFLERYAGSDRRIGSAGEPPRITKTARFEKKHRKVPPRFWQDPRVKSAANCEACHRDAAVTGRYSEHNLAIPELNRRDHD